MSHQLLTGSGWGATHCQVSTTSHPPDALGAFGDADVLVVPWRAGSCQARALPASQTRLTNQQCDGSEPLRGCRRPVGWAAARRANDTEP